MTIADDATRRIDVTGKRFPRPRAPMPRHVVSRRLVGRDLELEQLVDTTAASPAVAVIEGEAGIGKSRLVAELAARAELSDRRVLIGSCRRIREPFPLGPVIEALRGLADELTSARLSPVAGSLRPLLPELSYVLPLQPDPLDDRAAERHRILRGLSELLGTLGPVVLVLEDLHWADHRVPELSDG